MGIVQDDPLGNLNAMEGRTKEAWVKIMSAREARNDLRECYRREGVNHVDQCAQFAKAYLNGVFCLWVRASTWDSAAAVPADTACWRSAVLSFLLTDFARAPCTGLTFIRTRCTSDWATVLHWRHEQALPPRRVRALPRHHPPPGARSQERNNRHAAICDGPTVALSGDMICSRLDAHEDTSRRSGGDSLQESHGIASTKATKRNACVRRDAPSPVLARPVHGLDCKGIAC